MKYDVFISYSRKDTAVADKIVEAFRRAKITYFIDKQGIGGGFEFPVVLAEAILESRIVLFLASENSYESKFTNAELTFAFNEKPRNSILPYIIDGSTMPPALRFVFASINWRAVNSHPVDTVLVNDILTLLGRPSVAPHVPTTPKPVERIWKVGDYYNVDGKEGVVFWVDETGEHGKIVSMDQTKLQWCTDDEYKKELTGIATDRSNGMNNLRSIMKIDEWRNKYPAFAWCADHGDGWYLPAIDELKDLLLNDEVHAKVNGTLEQKRVSVMYSKGTHKWYWSSTRSDMRCAWSVYMSYGNAYNDDREYDRFVRAVSTF